MPPCGAGCGGFAPTVHLGRATGPPGNFPASPRAPGGCGHRWPAGTRGGATRRSAMPAAGSPRGPRAAGRPGGGAARRLRTPLARWHAVRVQAAMDHARGRFAEAVAHGREAEALARRAEHAGTLTPSVGFLLGLAAITGDPAILPAEPERTGFGDQATEFLRAMHATWKLAMGDRAEAHRLYRTLSPLTSVPMFVRISALGGTAELAAAFDDRDTAAEVYRLLRPWAEYIVCGGAGGGMTGGAGWVPLGVAPAAGGGAGGPGAPPRAA